LLAPLYQEPGTPTNCGQLRRADSSGAVCALAGDDLDGELASIAISDGESE
jgi:hypothetical protein